MDFGGPRRQAKSDINVTPLIDIVLVLLIVFIVLVPSLTRTLPVVVPRVVTEPQPPKADINNPPVVISVMWVESAKGYTYQLQSDKLQLAELPRKLAPVIQLQPLGKRKVFLRIQEDVPYQIAVNVLDQIRIASDQAKEETRAKPGSTDDGGDTKVAISMKGGKT